ncbi:MAG: GDSL-type esterase/lipase family protein [Eubacteriales bacterium]
MKHYENFDNSFFIKIICVIAAIVLVLVIGVALFSVFSSDKPSPNDSDAETFIFDNTDTTETADSTLEPEHADAASDEPQITSAPDTETDTQDTETDAPAEPEQVFTVLPETEDMGDDYIGKIIFVGDSTTYGLKAYKMLADGKNTKQVWTSSSASLSLNEILTKVIVYPETGKEMTIADAAAAAKPEYMIITLGLEGVTFLSEDDFKAQYTSLVEKIKEVSPDTKLMLQSIFPVAASYTEENKLNNPLIDKANEWVKAVAEATGVRYLDTQSVLKDDAGALISKYDNGGNGINLNDAGFTAVLDYIRTHGYK